MKEGGRRGKICSGVDSIPFVGPGIGTGGSPAGKLVAPAGWNASSGGMQDRCWRPVRGRVWSRESLVEEGGIFFKGDFVLSCGGTEIVAENVLKGGKGM